MTTREIVSAIDALLAESTVDLLSKRRRLRELARKYWNVVFPEYGTTAYLDLSTEVKEHRWRVQREKNELASCSNPQAVLRVLDSPGTGDPLNWVN